LRNLGFQKFHKAWVHELVFVWNVQADEACIFHRSAVSRLDFRGWLHHEDDVRPFDEVVGERVLGVFVGAGGGCLDTGPIGKHLFGCRAAQLVLAADEQDVFNVADLSPADMLHAALLGERDLVLTLTVAQPVFLGAAVVAV
jgi:hypothetical protein